MTIPTPIVVDDIPDRTRESKWAEVAKWIMAQPLDKVITVDGTEHPSTPTYQYNDVGQNVASDFKAKHGLDAANRNAKAGKATLYVRYVPSLVPAVKAEATRRSAAAKARHKTTTK